MNSADFDHAAKTYDLQFSQTGIGLAQRAQVWRNIQTVIGKSESPSILEINCGTGDDAFRWSQNHSKVLATDISPQMVSLAQTKYPTLSFEVLDSRKLNALTSKYDVIFSNFGGLNCLSPQEIKDFFTNAHKRLNDGGRLILVVMGKKCTWDRFYHRIKGQKKDVNRRNTASSLAVDVNGEKVSTWYYSPSELNQMAGPKFERKRTAPIGLFVPPSYLSPFFKSKQIFLGVLKGLDRLFPFRSLSNYADHYFMCLEKSDTIKSVI